MTILVKYDAARQALALARTVDEVKDIIDRTEAMRAYGRQIKDRSMENDAKEIRWRAYRRVGEMIKAQKATIGLGKPGPKRELDSAEEFNSRVSLEDAGIDNKLSSRAQKYADMAEDSFERLVQRCRAHADAEDEAAPLDLLRNEEKQAVRAAQQEAFKARTALGCTVADLRSLISDGKRYGVIYADPPWEFKVWSGAGKDRSADNHYKTGGLDEIKALPVAELAAENCVLLMWCVMPELPGALDVINAWGFEYKTVGFTWVKQNESGDGLFFGMGYWTRANAEICLLATRGKPLRLDAGVPQALLHPIMEHSRKPDEFHKRAERLVGGPYLELYARRERDGWTTWGNEIPRSKFLPAHDAETGEVIAA